MAHTREQKRQLRAQRKRDRAAEDELRGGRRHVERRAKPGSYGLLTPRGRSCNGRHERVSHRIKVIFDSNDMPVMRSNRVATETVVLSHKNFPNYRICSRATLAGPARSGGRSGDEAQRLAQWFQRLEVMIEAPIRCCGTQGSTGRPGTAGRQLASRADQTTERGLWARAYRGSNWLLSRPSTARELPRAM